MSGPGLPTIQVLLDNFTGTFPYDITAYVRLTEPQTWQRGTPDEQAAVGPGSYQITLDNTDGRFTYGSGTYGVSANQQIRLKVEGGNRVTARVQSWPVEWPTGGQEFSVARITAIDDLARAQRRKLLPAVAEDIQLKSPFALYQLGEETGATLAADSSGNTRPSLGLDGIGTPMTFGTGVGAADGLPAPNFLGGTFLRGSGANFLPAGSTTFTVHCWILTTMSVATFIVPIVYIDGGDGNPTGIYMTVTAGAGKLTVVSQGAQVTTPGGVNINDGAGLVPRHLALTVTGGTMTAYIDGVSSATVAAPTLAANGNRITVAGSDLPGTTAYIGTISQVAVHPTALTAADLLKITNAGKTDYVGETPAARLTRLAGYLGLATGTIDTGGTTTMAAAQQNGRSGLDIIVEVQTAMQGTVFLNGSNALTSRNGYTMTNDITPDLSVDAQYVSESTVVPTDMSQVANIVTGHATGSENQFVATNAFSRFVHGDYPVDYEWSVSTDVQALDRTNWQVGVYASPQTRIPLLTIDLMSLSGATRTAALTLEIGKFIHLVNMPSQTPGGGGVNDLIVLGISETISTTEWSLTINCIRHSQFAGWILGDSLWGVLDATTKLYF